MASPADRIEILKCTLSLFTLTVSSCYSHRSNGRPHYSLCSLFKLSLTFIPWQSSPRPTSPVNTPSGSSTARPSSPKPPGGPATAIRRKAAADLKEKKENTRPNSTRAAGMGGSSSTMLKLYTDESPGLKVDPVVVLVLSVGFIVSVVALHSTSACKLCMFGIFRLTRCSHCQDYEEILIINSLPTSYSGRLGDQKLSRCLEIENQSRTETHANPCTTHTHTHTHTYTETQGRRKDDIHKCHSDPYDQRSLFYLIRTFFTR